MKFTCLLARRGYAAMIASACLAFTAAQVGGAILTYGNPAGAQDFTDGANWVGGIAPGTSDEGRINGVDGTTNYAYLDTFLTFQRAILGENAGDSGGLEIRSNGSLTGTSTSGHIVGRNGVGIFTMDGGTLTATGRLNLGQLAGSNGTMTQTGGDVTTAGLSITPDNANSQGSYTLNSGNLKLSDSFEIGRTGTGVFNMHGGTVTTASALNAFIQVGRTGSGKFIQTAGDVTVGRASAVGYGFAIAPQAGSTGLYELSGGTLTIADTNLGMSIGATNGSASSSGTLKVIGNSATIAIANNYTQFPGATLALDISAGISPINASANATLSGILDVKFSQTPTVGQQFTILNYGTLTGTFATFDSTVDSPAGLNSVGLSINYGTGSGSAVVLTVDSVATALVPGDFDGDGDVDGADFVAWQTNFPKQTGALLTEGDADHDGDVDGADFVVWQTNFPFSPAPGTSPVPEPSAFLMIGIAILIGTPFRNRLAFCRP